MMVHDLRDSDSKNQEIPDSELCSLCIMGIN